MDKFKFPDDIWYFGRPYSIVRYVEKNGVKYAVYREDTIGVEQSFTENLFKYHEYYGNIERSEK
jgi:hypothetical protein